MTQASAAAENQTQLGLAALHEGNFNGAKEHLQQAVELGVKDASTFLALAFAHDNLGQDQPTLDALDQALAIDPRNLRAMLYKADHQTRMQRTRKAMVFYDAALRIAADESELPQDVQQGLVRAQGVLERFSDDYEDYLLEGLKSRGFSEASAHPRFLRALDISLGKRQLYHQAPTRFHYPELPQNQFFPRGIFPWMEQLEAATDSIRAELLAVMAGADEFSPYLNSDADVVQFNDASNIDNDDWGAYFFYENGKLNEAHAAACPQTANILQQMPLPHIPGNTPHALFSKLAANARIPPTMD